MKYKIPVYYPKNLHSDNDIKSISILKPDLIIVMGYGKIIPKQILCIPKFGCINVHVSLLPRWRGASPIEHAIINGDKKTGISIFQLNEKLDTGEIITSEEVDIKIEENREDLTSKLNKIGIKLLLNILPDFLENKLKLKKQNEIKATYANKLTSENRKINFNNDVLNVYNHIRAFAPKPCAWFILNNQRIKIIKCSYKVCESQPSNILNQEFHIGCLNGVIIPEIVQREGKKPVEIKDFLRGFDLKNNYYINE